MNLQPQLKYMNHTNTMRQGTIEHLLLKNTKKNKKKRNICTWIRFQGKMHYSRYSLNISQSSRSICSLLMFIAINWPKIFPHLPNFVTCFRKYQFLLCRFVAFRDVFVSSSSAPELLRLIAYVGCCSISIC